LHNNSDKDEITIAKDNSVVNLEECIDRYYVLKNQINKLDESLAKCTIEKEETVDVEDNKKQLNILNSKFEARQQGLKDIKAIIKATLDCFKCGGGLNYKKYNMLLEERVELENEIGKIKAEIHSIEFIEKSNKDEYTVTKDYSISDLKECVNPYYLPLDIIDEINKIMENKLKTQVGFDEDRNVVYVFTIN
jgi:hypothetical protein